MDDGVALDAPQNGKIVASEAPEALDKPAPHVGRSRLTVVWALWGVFVVALALFLAFGRATVGNGILTGTPVRVTTLWGQYAGLMRAWGFGGPLIVAVWAFAAAGLLLSVAAVWFAFAARDDPDAAA